MIAEVSSLRKVSASDALSTFDPSTALSNCDIFQLAGTGHSDKEVVVDEDAPLPTQRELARLLCKIIDDTMYSRSTGKAALRQIEIWAHKDDTGIFSKDYMNVGGIQITMNFLEDNLTDVEGVRLCLAVLNALMVENANHSSSVPESLVAQSGADVLVRAFEVHLLYKTSGNSRSMLNGMEIWNSISSMLFKKTDADEDEGSSDVALETLENSSPAIEEDPQLAHFETAIMALGTLQKVIPHTTPDKARQILEQVYNTVPKVSLQNDRMMAAVTKCLVEALKYADMQDPKQVITVTIKVMKHYSHQDEVTKNGCLILQDACSKISKADRKKLGVVAALGNILASDSISKEVKDIADKILDEQIK
jgi:hypothetical protein